jgi:pyridoxine kinase
MALAVVLPPRVAAIHSLAGFGRCSLTVIIPVLSAMGIQVCPMPTAVLSTHSGGFGDMSFVDLTDAMEAHAAHWRGLGLNFDAIYSGFLGSARQIETVAGFIDAFGRGPRQLVLVDPVMADNGKLYRTYTPEMRDLMRHLAAKADILTPNVTETCFLLNEPYSDQPMSDVAIRRLLVKLSDLGPPTVVVKSIRTDDGRHANVAYRRVDDSFCVVPFERLPVDYPGTGDTFGSVLLGGLLTGKGLCETMARATAFLSHAVHLTQTAGTPAREGVLLEAALPWLWRDAAAAAEVEAPDICDQDTGQVGPQEGQA